MCTDTWSVSYSDPSGNHYRFWKVAGEEAALFAYHPIRPEQSSSGMYSGGEAREGALNPNQVESLFTWVRDLEADTENHATSRRKGTGSFRVGDRDGTVCRFILRAGRNLEAFDAFVVAIRHP